MVWRRARRHPPLLSTDVADGTRLAVILVVLFFVLVTDLASLPATAFSDGSVTTSGFTAEEAEVVSAAVARFDNAGLSLPSVHIRRAGRGGPCERHGRTTNTWPVIYISVCQVEEPVIVHELAHAWTFDHMGTADQLQWNERRGVPTWLSRQEPWELRGSEHAADILTWYLYWSEFAVERSRIGGDNTPAQYLADIEWLLTNGEASGGLEVFSSRSSLIALAFPATR